LVIYLAWFTGIREMSAPPQQLGVFQSWPTGLLPFVFLAAVLLVSVASYHTIEVPSRRYFNRVAKRLHERAHNQQLPDLAGQFACIV
jgi:peptidoglycan/LPS O-acetylase OafA/YrhL